MVAIEGLRSEVPGFTLHLFIYLPAGRLLIKLIWTTWPPPMKILGLQQSFKKEPNTIHVPSLSFIR